MSPSATAMLKNPPFELKPKAFGPNISLYSKDLMIGTFVQESQLYLDTSSNNKIIFNFQPSIITFGASAHF